MEQELNEQDGVLSKDEEDCIDEDEMEHWFN